MDTRSSLYLKQAVLSCAFAGCLVTGAMADEPAPRLEVPPPRKVSRRVPSHGSSSRKQVREAPRQVVAPSNPASHPNRVRRKSALGPPGPHRASRDRTRHRESTTSTIE